MHKVQPCQVQSHGVAAPAPSLHHALLWHTSPHSVSVYASLPCTAAGSNCEVPVSKPTPAWPRLPTDKLAKP